MARNHNYPLSLLETVFLFSSSLILMFFLITSALSESRIYDEVTYVQAGYGFLTEHDFRLDPFNPPLAREIVALPVLLNRSVIDDPILFWPRMMVVLFAVALLFLVYFFSRDLFGKVAAMLAVALFVFEPNLLAHGHYATMDMIFTFFYVLVLYLFFKWRNTFSTKKLLLFGVVLGLALSTKISSVTFLLIPLFVLFILTEKKKNNLLLKKYWASRWKRVGLLLLVTLVSLWGTYFFTFEPFLGYRLDPNRPAIALAREHPLLNIGLTVPVPLGSYISTIKTILVFNYTDWYSKNSMFLQEVRSDGFPGFYFLPLLLLKLPIPLLMLFASSVLLVKKQKNMLYLFIPMIAILLGIFFSKVMLVTRYILPVIPLIIIASCAVVTIKLKNSLILPIVVLGLLCWNVMGTLRSFPHFVSFINEIGGGVGNGYNVVFDANYDWGQGLLALKAHQADSNRALQLAYFGDLDPAKLGVVYDRIQDANLHDGSPVVPLRYDKDHTVAISTTCWYLCGYYRHDRLRNERPVKIVGGSILLFEK